MALTNATTTIMTDALQNVEIANGMQPLLLLAITAIGVIAITRNSREIKVLLFPLYMFFLITGRNIFMNNTGEYALGLSIAMVLALLWIFNTLQVNTFSNIIGTNAFYKKTTWTEAGRFKHAAEGHKRDILSKRASQAEIARMDKLNARRNKLELRRMKGQGIDPRSGGYIDLNELMGLNNMSPRGKTGVKLGPDKRFESSVVEKGGLELRDILGAKLPKQKEGLQAHINRMAKGDLIKPRRIRK